MESLERFLDAPVDYSTEFTDRVRGLADALAAALGAPVRHETDMNYNPGQLLVVYLGPNGTVTGDEVAADFAVKIAVSSRGPLWALLASRKGAGPREWFPGSISDVQSGSVLGTIEKTMGEAGLARVPDESLERPVPGRVTELDGAPATVRDLLFCELC